MTDDALRVLRALRDACTYDSPWDRIAAVGATSTVAIPIDVLRQCAAMFGEDRWARGEALTVRVPVVCPDCGGQGRLPCPNIDIDDGGGPDVASSHPDDCACCDSDFNVECSRCEGRGGVWGTA